MDYEQEYEEYSQKHMSRSRLIFSRCMGWIGRILVFSIIALVLWRVLLSGRIPKNMQTLLVNDNTYAAYVAQGNSLTMYTQPQEQVIMQGNTAGYFWVCQAVFIPEADQIQVLVRYNNSTLRHIAEDFSMTDEEAPARTDTIVDVSLVITVDPDPNNDNVSDRQKIRIHPTEEPIQDQTLMYNYRKYVFDNVGFDGDTFDAYSTINLAIEFYYIDSVDYDLTPWGTLVIYEPQYETEPVKLTARDKRALKQYAAAQP